jgi:hypothetical protein
MRARTTKHPLDNIYLTWTDQACPHRWVYVQKWKQIEFRLASYHILDCHMSSLLPFTCVAWIIWSKYQAWPYLPPRLGFWPKWRSILAWPWSGVPKIWRRTTFVLIRARGRSGVVRGVVIGRCLLFLLVHNAMLYIEAEQPKLLVQLLLRARPWPTVNTEQTRLWQGHFPFLSICK